MATAIRLHDIPYERFVAQDRIDYRGASQMSDLLRAADALDRYRQPKLKWWPDPGRVNVPEFARLQRFAYELVVETEQAGVAGGRHDGAAAVAHVLSTRGVL